MMKRAIIVKKIQQFISALFISLTLIASPALANDFGTAVTAYSKGDYQTALTLFSSLAEQGDAKAQFILNAMYEYGEGTVKNSAEAFKCYKSAAEQGLAEAQYNLGVMYENGRGTVKNYADAFKWYKLAAKQGHAWAQNNLGLMYKDGIGTIKDSYEAFKWFKLAAKQGLAEAQRNLAIQYALRSDFITAHQWANIIQLTGGNSTDVIEQLEKFMTQADIRVAENRALACLESGYTDC